MVTIKFKPEDDIKGFEVLRRTRVAVICLRDDRYVCGAQHLKALHEAGLSFEVVSTDLALAVRYLLNTYQQLGISCQVVSADAEPVVQISSVR